ncbi:hypothetical protein RMR21_016305 [Agrobacterium sp. rho-8.1]|nr:hypothetical protein [Agrobacterium sp. rho-8.1]
MTGGGKTVGDAAQTDLRIGRCAFSVIGEKQAVGTQNADCSPVGQAGKMGIDNRLLYFIQRRGRIVGGAWLRSPQPRPDSLLIDFATLRKALDCLSQAQAE